MRLRLTRNGQLHLIHNFSHLLPPKHLIFGEISKNFVSGGGGYIGKFFEFSNFFKSFHINAAENDPQLQILPKKWLRLGQNGHFCIFFYLFPQNWGWDWLGMVNFTWFTTFPIFCHQSISFLEKSQKFLFQGGGGTSANFLSFPTFSYRFTPMLL